jgi:hypothetical protein
MALKQISLWSWLTVKEIKTEIFCPPDLEVTNEELAQEIAARIKANRLPAVAELCEVYWDGTDTKQQRTLVRHTGDLDVIQFIVGVDQMGAFSYVEEKVILKPPPEPPARELRQKKQFTEERPSEVGVGRLALVGILIITISFVAISRSIIVFLAVAGFGALLIALAFKASSSSDKAIAEWDRKLKETQEWNQRIEEEQSNWDNALESWYEDVLKGAHLSRTDDVTGRFTLAVSSTVRQVVKALFEDRQAELRERTEKERTQKEIEEELERRKQEGFK